MARTKKGLSKGHSPSPSVSPPSPLLLSSDNEGCAMDQEDNASSNNVGRGRRPKREGSSESTDAKHRRQSPSNNGRLNRPSQDNEPKCNSATAPDRRESAPSTSANLDYLQKKVTELVPTDEGTFVIILQPKCKTDSFGKVNPLKTKQGLILLGNDISIKILRYGGLVTKTRSPETADKLFKINVLNGIEVETNTPRSERMCKGVITGVFYDTTDEELLNDINEGNNADGIIAVRTEKLGGPLSTARAVTFQGKTLPRRINVFLSFQRVRIFFEKPRQCFRCQRFNHSSSECKGKMRCLFCGEHSHSHKDCEKKKSNAKPICCNCQGDHPAWSGKCEARKVQVAICKFKAFNKVTHAAAKAVIIPPRTSYAEALRRISENKHSKSLENQRSLTPPARRENANWPKPCENKSANTETSTKRAASPATDTHSVPVQNKKKDCSFSEAVKAPAVVPKPKLNQKSFCDLVTLIIQICTESKNMTEITEQVVKAASNLDIKLPPKVAEGLFIQYEESDMYD